MRNRNIFWGLLLIAAAVALVARGMGVLPDIPWFKAIVSIGFVSYSLKQIWKRQFFGAFLALGCVAWMWETELGIEHLTPFPIVVAAGLVGAGFNMLFGKKHRIVTIKSDGQDISMDEARVENWEDGRHVTLENVFNATSKYVNSDAFSSADFENVFGSANVYFNNAIIAGNEAVVNVENVFGQLNLYFPSTWRLQVNKDSVFGGVKICGRPCTDPDAPVIYMNAESVFGNITIFFE